MVCGGDNLLPRRAPEGNRRDTRCYRVQWAKRGMSHCRRNEP